MRRAEIGTEKILHSILLNACPHNSATLTFLSLGSSLVILNTESDEMSRGDQVGEIAVSLNQTASGLWGLLRPTERAFQVSKSHGMKCSKETVNIMVKVKQSSV